ncbi:MAG: PP0621 family protein [Brachymonas sp.]|nr:PP0621 family protein [Brachymonas sp.]
MTMKYALPLVVAVLVWWHVLRKLLAFARKLSSGPAAVRAGAAGSGHRPQPAQAMQPCQLCGVHAPHTEVVQWAGRAYCCAEHARQAASGD